MSGAEPLRTAAIRYEPDGYATQRTWLMGRHVAGDGFLRAAVQARGEGPLYGWTPHRSSAQAFATAVAAIDPTATAEWIKAQRPQDVPKAGGVLYLGDAMLTPAARLRLRVGAGHYSICGVTHTTSTHGALQQIAELLSEPVAPWDALVCTSRAVVATARRVLEAQADYLRWRFGPDVQLSHPQLPVIPLGVHCADFADAGSAKATAREALGIAPDDIVALFVGRLTFTSKAHPFAMYHALQAAAERTGRRIVLVLCGWAPNEDIAEAYSSGAALFAPDVRFIAIDGRERQLRQGGFAAADIFVSLSDGIQETFGLTPLEAMAAGLPAVVSDWDGYRETVRDGVDGFRITSWAPQSGAAGADIATHYETEALSYDGYLWAAASATSVDLEELTKRLVTLVEDPELRRRMGDAGRRRAQESFDWRHVFSAYQALWGDLNGRRLAALQSAEERAWVDRAPRAAPSRLDPFDAFSGYPTYEITPETLVRLVPDATLETYRLRRAHVLFRDTASTERIVGPLWSVLQQGERSVGALGAHVATTPSALALVLGTLAKMGLVALRRP